MSSLLVLSNVADVASAHALARLLIDQRLAACVSILPAVQSIYRWQGAVEEASEVSLLIKTSADRYSALEAMIRCHHPYELPEIMAIPITHGFAPYLQWIAAETRPEQNA